MGKLDNKVAIVTGSGGGIGKQIAETFAKEGAKVVIADFNEDALNETVKEFESNDFTVHGVKVNVASNEEVEKMIDDTIDTFGRVDILVNNAGVSDNMQAAANVTDEVWNRVINIDLHAVMYGLRKVIPHFIENGGGTIINMASICGITGGRGGLAYTAAKHAVVGMTKNVASHYAPQNIRCNAIAPAGVQTALTGSMKNVDEFGMQIATRGSNIMGEVGSSEDIANIALFLASEESRYINGVALAADAAWSAY